MPAVTASAVAAPAPASLKVTTVDDAFDIKNLFVSDANVRSSTVSSLAIVAQEHGTDGLSSVKFGEAVVKALSDKKNPAVREAAADCIHALVKAGAIKALEPIFVPSGIYNGLLENFADKTPAARTAAIEAVREYVVSMNVWATPILLPVLLQFIRTAGKWQAKIGGLTIFDQLIVSTPTPVAFAMHEIIPVLSATVWDTKTEVKKAARDSLTKAAALVSNKDIENLIPALIKAHINPTEEVSKTIRLLAATTFVADVDSTTLALVEPLLSRGLNEKLTAVKRSVAVYAPLLLLFFNLRSNLFVVSSTACQSLLVMLILFAHWLSRFYLPSSRLRMLLVTLRHVPLLPGLSRPFVGLVRCLRVMALTFLLLSVLIPLRPLLLSPSSTRNLVVQLITPTQSPNMLLP